MFNTIEQSSFVISQSENLEDGNESSPLGQDLNQKIS